MFQSSLGSFWTLDSVAGARTAQRFGGSAGLNGNGEAVEGAMTDSLILRDRGTNEEYWNLDVKNGGCVHGWGHVPFVEISQIPAEHSGSACGTRINNELARYSWWQVGRYAWDQIIHIFCNKFQQSLFDSTSLDIPWHSFGLLWNIFELVEPGIQGGACLPGTWGGGASEGFWRPWCTIALKWCNVNTVISMISM